MGTAGQELVVMYSCRLKKINKFTFKRDRNFVVSNLNIYNFKQKSKAQKQNLNLILWPAMMQHWLHIIIKEVDFLLGASLNYELLALFAVYFYRTAPCCAD